MVPNLIWALRNFGPEKYGPPEIWSQHEIHIMWGPNFFRLKFFGVHISCRPNLWDIISQDPKKYGAQMRSETISALALISRGHLSFINPITTPERLCSIVK